MNKKIETEEQVLSPKKEDTIRVLRKIAEGIIKTADEYEAIEGSDPNKSGMEFCCFYASKVGPGQLAASHLAHASDGFMAVALFDYLKCQNQDALNEAIKKLIEWREQDAQNPVSKGGTA